MGQACTLFADQKRWKVSLQKVQEPVVVVARVEGVQADVQKLRPRESSVCDVAEHGTP